jgi:hypothetical protein
VESADEGHDEGGSDAEKADLRLDEGGVVYRDGESTHHHGVPPSRRVVASSMVTQDAQGVTGVPVTP